MASMPQPKPVPAAPLSQIVDWFIKHYPFVPPIQAPFNWGVIAQAINDDGEYPTCTAAQCMEAYSVD